MRRFVAGVLAVLAHEVNEVAEVRHLKGLDARHVSAPAGTSSGKLAVAREVVGQYNAALAAASSVVWGDVCSGGGVAAAARAPQ